MELELGVKLTKVLEDFSSAEFFLAKDRSGPLFLSRETDTMFTLTAHLRGYRREHIKIDINEDGTRIAISGQKPVQETVLLGWKVYKKDVEMRGFRKAFKVPEGVILDEIKSWFSEDESVLTISMPKLVKGVRGIGLEEVKEEDLSRGGSGTMEVAADEVKGETLQGEENRELKAKDKDDIDGAVGRKPEEVQEMTPERSVEPARKKVTFHEQSHWQEAREKTEDNEGGTMKKAQPLDFLSSGKDLVVEEYKASVEIPRIEREAQEKESEKEKISVGIQADNLHLKRHTDQDQESKDQSYCEKNYVLGRQNGIQEKEEEQSPVVNLAPEEAQQGELSREEKEEVHPKTSKLCVPMLAGSALFVSVIVFVIHFIRTKNQSSKRRQ